MAVNLQFRTGNMKVQTTNWRGRRTLVFFIGWVYLAHLEWTWGGGSQQMGSSVTYTHGLFMGAKGQRAN